MGADKRNDRADLGARMLAVGDQLQATTDIEQVAEVFAAAVLPLGMTGSSSGMISGPKALSDDIFHFTNWPEGWLALYRARDFVKKDPLPRWAMVSGAPVAWSEVMRRLPANDPGHEVYAAALDWGFSEGFLTPVRALDGSLGLVSVGGARGAFDDAEKMYLQGVSAATFHRAEALSTPDGASQIAGILSRRERECLSLLAEGLTDREIGGALGVSDGTARFHLDNARRKMGARSRPQLVALAATLL